MRYSLASRFRGTIIGALLGDLASSSGKQPVNSGEMAVMGIESLISLSRLDLDDWIARQQREFPDLGKSDRLPEIIIATLPVALFFHENTVKLRENLISAIAIWSDSPVVRDGTLAVGYVLAKSLTEKLDPKTLIAETISFIGSTPTSLAQALLKVNELLIQGAELERVQAELSQFEKPSQAIAIAFYCFLSTLEDFRLSMRGRFNSSPHLRATSAITGALSGAYNSTSGIPVTWLLGLKNSKQIIELSDRLVAVWSGAYNAPDAENLQQESAIVYYSPRVIKSR